jgi:serine/threonine protein kinase
MAYEDGTALINYERFDMSNSDIMNHAIPFWHHLPNASELRERVSAIGVDTPLPLPSAVIEKICPLRVYCKRLKKTSYGGSINSVETKHMADLLQALKHHHTLVTNTMNKELLDIANLLYYNDDPIVMNKKYIVKVQRASTMRTMLTGLKEVYAMHTIYRSSWSKYQGKDIIPQPVMGCPMWNGKKWLYVIVMEKVSGVPLNRVSHLSYRLLNVKNHNKKKVIDAVANTVSAFWALGFAHNDLHWKNIIYDVHTNTAKIIDLESCVNMLEMHVSRFREELCVLSLNNDMFIEHLPSLFDAHYKLPSISLLYVASHYCEKYEDKDNRIYNTDEHLLPMIKDLL